MDREDPPLDDEALLKSIVTVSLYSEEMDDCSDVRDAVVGKAPPGGRTVKVLYDRLEEIWSGCTPEAAFLCGNVIAHEIGHLLLPGGAHARDGLMAPEISIPIATSRSLVLHACGAQAPPQRVDICSRRLTRRAARRLVHSFPAPAPWTHPRDLANSRSLGHHLAVPLD